MNQRKLCPIVSEIRTQVEALSGKPGVVGWYIWTGDRSAEIRTLQLCAFRARLAIVRMGGGNGHEWAELVPLSKVPVSVKAGTRGRGRKKAADRRARARRADPFFKAWRRRGYEVKALPMPILMMFSRYRRRRGPKGDRLGQWLKRWKRNTDQ